MKLQKFVFKCDPNGHQFESFEVPENSYGEFLLRDASGSSVRSLNALADTTYDEVAKALGQLAVTAQIPLRKRAEILQKIFGEVACDPDERGAPLRIGQHASCPICGTTAMKSWEASDPPFFKEVAVQPVTHRAWRAMGVVGREAALNSGLARSS
jgi:hypothetical protein